MGMMMMMKRGILQTLVLSLALEVAVFMLFCEDGLIIASGAVDRGAERIDVHTHFVPAFYRDILLKRNQTSGGKPILPWNENHYLERQAKFNVKTSVLSIPTPGVTFFDHHEVSERRDLARMLNECGRHLSVKYPGQLQFFATLPLPDVEGALAEAEYSLDVLKAAGVILLTNSNGVYLGNPDLDPLMDVLNNRSAVAFVHPNCLFGDLDETGIPPFALDFLLDTSRAATNLMARNVIERYPNIKWLLAHSGGFIPLAAGRLSLSYSDSLQNTTREDIVRRLKTFYVELGCTHASSLPSVLDFVPGEQILFGSDFPSEPEGLSYVSSALDAFPLTVQQRYDINFGNGIALFGESRLNGSVFGIEQEKITFEWKLPWPFHV